MSTIGITNNNVVIKLFIPSSISDQEAVSVGGDRRGAHNVHGAGQGGSGGHDEVCPR